MQRYILVFPGIGYTEDKPLLYYSRKLALKYGYTYMWTAKYPALPGDIKNNLDDRHEFMHEAMADFRKAMLECKVQPDDEFLLISKSIGTTLATRFSEVVDNPSKIIYFTPLAETFDYAHPHSGIVFHGTGDPWANTDIVRRGCRELGLSLFITEGANHSMETNDVNRDIMELNKIIATCEDYIRG